MRRATILIALVGALGILALLPVAAGARASSASCGKVGGVPIHAHDIGCGTARQIYKADMSGKLPAGWSCSASLARCYRGEVGASSEYMWWRRTTYRYMQRRLRAQAVVLGGVVYGAPNGEGWGSERPGEISNGGDAGGTLLEVHWSSWGGAVAHGTADHPIFRPNGGYYSRPVVAQLKATRLGHCEGHRAYLKLLIREPKRPGGPLGPWLSWSGPKTLCEPY
jgi:hypothetical protein